MTVPANQFRQDLLNAGKGNGVHAYSIATPNRLKNNGAHSVSVRFPNGAGLSNVPQTIACFNAPPAVMLTAPANGARFTAPATITLSALASDPGGTAPPPITSA